MNTELRRWSTHSITQSITDSHLSYTDEEGQLFKNPLRTGGNIVRRAPVFRSRRLKYDYKAASRDLYFNCKISTFSRIHNHSEVSAYFLTYLVNRHLNPQSLLISNHRICDFSRLVFACNSNFFSPDTWNIPSNLKVNSFNSHICGSNFHFIIYTSWQTNSVWIYLWLKMLGPQKYCSRMVY